MAGRRSITAAGRRSVGAIRPPRQNLLREIHCLRGTPSLGDCLAKNDQEQINNISLGIIDLVYPAHWQPYIAQDLGQQTDIDIYLDRHVVRQGRYLSLHDEVKTFRYSTGYAVRLSLRARCWCCLCCYSGSPLDMPLKFTLMDERRADH